MRIKRNPPAKPKYIHTRLNERDWGISSEHMIRAVKKNSMQDKTPVHLLRSRVFRNLLLAGNETPKFNNGNLNHMQTRLNCLSGYFDHRYMSLLIQLILTLEKVDVYVRVIHHMARKIFPLNFKRGRHCG